MLFLAFCAILLSSSELCFAKIICYLRITKCAPTTVGNPWPQEKNMRSLDFMQYITAHNFYLAQFFFTQFCFRKGGDFFPHKFFSQQKFFSAVTFVWEIYFFLQKFFRTHFFLQRLFCQGIFFGLIFFSYILIVFAVELDFFSALIFQGNFFFTIHTYFFSAQD